MPHPLHTLVQPAHTDIQQVATSGIVEFFYTLFVRFWYAWPVLIGLIYLKLRLNRNKNF